MARVQLAHFQLLLPQQPWERRVWAKRCREALELLLNDQMEAVV